MVAFYAPSNMMATKLVCGIMKYKDVDAEPIKKWFSKRVGRKSEKILGEVLSPIKDNEAKSVGMVEEIIGCPHKGRY